LPIWSPKDRGPMVGAYAIFDLRGNALPLVKFMGVDEIEAHRQKHSKQWKSGPLPEWYAEKTPIRMGVKLLPKDPRFAKTIALFEGMEEEAPVTVPAELQRLENVATIAAPSEGVAEGADWELDDDEPAELAI
jgi:recombinational DNA repair protein RecT